MEIKFMNDDEKEELERFIDRTSLVEVVNEIARICRAKAAHIQCNRYDDLVDCWDKAADKLEHVEFDVATLKGVKR